MTSEFKANIVGRYQECHKPSKIATELGVSVNTVKGFIRRFRRFGTVETPVRPGRPPKYTERDIRHLVRETRKNRREHFMKSQVVGLHIYQPGL